MIGKALNPTVVFLIYQPDWFVAANIWLAINSSGCLIGADSCFHTNLVLFSLTFPLISAVFTWHLQLKINKNVYFVLYCGTILDFRKVANILQKFHVTLIHIHLMLK